MILNSHPVPDHITKRITEQGGLAPNGQSLFRIIWGADRLTIIGGEWKSFDSSGNQTGSVVEEKLTVKYAGAEERWIMECWCPPENYGTPAEWEERHTKIINGKTIRELGVFPSNGEYELVKVLETPVTRAFVPLTATVVDAIIAVAVRNKHLPKAIRMAAYRDAQERVEKAKDQRMVDMIENIARPSWAKDDAYIIMPSNLTLDGKVI